MRFVTTIARATAITALGASSLLGQIERRSAFILPPPTAVAATVTGSSTTRVTWTPPSGVLGHEITRYRADNLQTIEKSSGQLSSGTSQWDDSGLLAGVTYQYVVTALYSSGTAKATALVTMPAATIIASSPTGTLATKTGSFSGTTLTSGTTAVSSLTAVTPTGPAPSGFTVSGTPMVAQLRWSAISGASFVVMRTDGAGATPIQRTPAGFTGVSVADTVTDPRLTYQYRLVANYSNGTWGETVANFVSPAPSNPTSLTASLLQPGAFRLSWPAVAGASKYRVDGATLPNTGGVTTPGALWYNVINVPPGPQTWQIVALFPNGVADYTNPTKTSVISRVAPTHQPFLVKTNGTGDLGTAQTHINAPCPSSDGVCGLLSWENFPTAYDNVTELGGHRTSECIQTKGGQNNKELVTVCHAYTGKVESVIVKGSRGMKFTSTIWDDLYTATPSPTAVLDSQGPRYVPHACLACHGGTYDPATGLVQGATLLPVDPGLVVGVTDLEKVRKLNELVLLSSPSPAVTQYINGLYGGFTIVPGAKAIQNYVPAGWASEANFYLQVVKKNCAMCHLAVKNGLDFLSAGNFLVNKDLIYTSVCKAKAMPHAEIPFNRFWTEDTGPIYVPGLLAVRLGYSSCPAP